MLSSSTDSFGWLFRSTEFNSSMSFLKRNSRYFEIRFSSELLSMASKKDGELSLDAFAVLRHRPSSSKVILFQDPFYEMVFEEETVLVMDSSMPEDLSFVVKAQRLRMISQGAIAMKAKTAMARFSFPVFLNIRKTQKQDRQLNNPIGNRTLNSFRPKRAMEGMMK